MNNQYEVLKLIASDANDTAVKLSKFIASLGTFSELLPEVYDSMTKSSSINYEPLEELFNDELFGAANWLDDGVKVKSQSFVGLTATETFTVTVDWGNLPSYDNVRITLQTNNSSYTIIIRDSVCEPNLEAYNSLIETLFSDGTAASIATSLNLNETIFSFANSACLNTTWEGFRYLLLTKANAMSGDGSALLDALSHITQPNNTSTLVSSIAAVISNFYASLRHVQASETAYQFNETDYHMEYLLPSVADIAGTFLTIAAVIATAINVVVGACISAVAMLVSFVSPFFEKKVDRGDFVPDAPAPLFAVPIMAQLFDEATSDFAGATWTRNAGCYTAFGPCCTVFSFITSPSSEDANVYAVGKEVYASINKKFDSLVSVLQTYIPNVGNDFRFARNPAGVANDLASADDLSPAELLNLYQNNFPLYIRTIAMNIFAITLIYAKYSSSSDYYQLSFQSNDSGQIAYWVSAWFDAIKSFTKWDDIMLTTRQCGADAYTLIDWVKSMCSSDIAFRDEWGLPFEDSTAVTKAPSCECNRFDPAITPPSYSSARFASRLLQIAAITVATVVTTAVLGRVVRKGVMKKQSKLKAKVDNAKDAYYNALQSGDQNLINATYDNYYSATRKYNFLGRITGYKYSIGTGVATANPAIAAQPTSVGPEVISSVQNIQSGSIDTINSGFAVNDAKIQDVIHLISGASPT